MLDPRCGILGKLLQTRIMGHGLLGSDEVDDTENRLDHEQCYSGISSEPQRVPGGPRIATTNLLVAEYACCFIRIEFTAHLGLVERELPCATTAVSHVCCEANGEPLAGSIGVDVVEGVFSNSLGLDIFKVAAERGRKARDPRCRDEKVLFATVANYRGVEGRRVVLELRVDLLLDLRLILVAIGKSLLSPFLHGMLVVFAAHPTIGRCTHWRIHGDL